MSEGQLPLFKGLPEPQPELPSPAVGRPEPLTLRLGDLPATYGSPEVEAGPSKRTLLMGAGGLVLAVAIGVGIGLQPLLQRRQMVVGLERQIAAGNITAAQTTLDRFAAAYPDHPAMLRYKGLVALGQAKWPEAREHLEAQVKREEKDPAANRGLGYLYGLAQIYQQVPPAEADLRKAMIQDWTHLFEYNVAGVDPAAPGLGTSIVSPASEAQKALGRLRAVGEATPEVEAAIAASRLLAATQPAERQAAFEALQGVDGVSLPSFQAYFTLGSSTALASAGSAPKADGPAATPPPIRVPGAEGIPEVPAPRLPEGFGQGAGAIEELPAGSTTPPSPNLVPSSRGAGALADALAAEEATEKKSGRSEVEYELGMPSGMGPQPRIRPFKVGTFERPHEDGTQEQVFYADLLNIRDPGTIQAAIGETVELPNTGFKAKVLEITDGGRRVVLEEIGRAVFVWRRAPGVKWYWDHADPANNQGRKSTGKSKAPAVRPR